MTNSTIEEVLRHYEEALTALKEATDGMVETDGDGQRLLREGFLFFRYRRGDMEIRGRGKRVEKSSRENVVVGLITSNYKQPPFEKRQRKQRKKLLTKLKNAIGLALKKGKSAPRIPRSIILDVLTARDAVQKVLNHKTQDLNGELINTVELDKLVELDNRLKKQAKWIAQAADWRASFNPPAEAWWWFLERKFDWFLRILLIFLSVLFFTAALTIMVKIAMCILSGGADWAGALAISVSVLALLTFKGSPTAARQMFIFFWVVVLFLVSFVSHSQLPQYYHHKGKKHYDARRLGSADANFKRALAFNPNNPETHFYLGRLYEELQNLQLARSEYEIAARGDYWPAYNNLSRLYILEEKYAKAAFLLNKPELPLPNLDTKLKYYIHKNLGWVRLRQNRLNDAKGLLLKAINYAKEYQDELKLQEKQARTQVQKAHTQLQQVPQSKIKRAQDKLKEAKNKLKNIREEDLVAAEQIRGSAHCLLAQVLEKQVDITKNVQTGEHWKKCKAHASEGQSPEEDEWIHIARKWLKSQNSSK